MNILDELMQKYVESLMAFGGKEVCKKKQNIPLVTPHHRTQLWQTIPFVFVPKPTFSKVANLFSNKILKLWFFAY